MKLIFENWRNYLKEELLVEVSLADARATLDKAAKKIISGYLYSKGFTMPRDYDPFVEKRRFKDGRLRKQKWRLNRWADHHKGFIEAVMTTISDDLTDPQAGQAVLWVIRKARKNPGDLETLIYIRDGTWLTVWEVRSSIEKFFHWQRFMSERDLNKIRSFDELNKIVRDADADIKAYQEKKSYEDAEAGTEVLLSDDEWKVAIIHNKGAACELGKGTDWCTAAPGLDYFEQYYKPEDPLFYFENKETGDKYQFSYGSYQFMDADDDHISMEAMLPMHRILVDLLVYEDRLNDYPELAEFEASVKSEGDTVNL